MQFRLTSPLMKYATLALVISASVDGAAAQTTTDPLTLGEAISAARENNPSFLTTQTQIRSAEWGVRAAYGNLVPSLSTSTSFGYTAGGQRRLDSVVLGEQPAQISSSYNIGMQLSLDGTTLLAPSVARAEARVAEQNVSGAAASLEAEVAQRYLNVLEDRAAVGQAERELARTEEHVRLAAGRLEVGAGTALEVRRAEVQRGQAQVRLIQARNTAANDLLLLSQTMGTPLPEDVPLAEEFELFEPAWTADQLVEIALAENPTLVARRAQADAAATRARAAATSYLPTISFNAGLGGYISQAGDIDPLVTQAMQSAQNSYNSCLEQNRLYGAVDLPLRSCSDPSSTGFEQGIRSNLERQNSGFPFDYARQPWNAGVTISLPIFTGLTRQQRIEEARIARSNAQYQVRGQELQTHVDVESSLRNLQTSYQSALLQQQIRSTAAEELRLVEERFRFGATTNVELVDAQASLAEAERAEIAAVYAFHRSLAVLEARLGQSLAR